MENEKINIFFVAGMFGSTLEYVMKYYSNELHIEKTKIWDDGSMHGFAKDNHIRNPEELFQVTNDYEISTIAYPLPNNELHEMFDKFINVIKNHHNILIYAESFDDAEMNMIFWYYKTILGIGKGSPVFDTGNVHVKKWNPNYNNWRDMQDWEIREWFSYFYPALLPGWMNKDHEKISTKLLKITNKDMLYNTLDTIQSVFNFCNLSFNDKDLNDFISEWLEKQQRYINEYKLLDKIIDNTIEKKDFTWNKICIVSEAILQKRLRELGFEIKCNDLNNFPTNSLELNKLLYRE